MAELLLIVSLLAVFVFGFYLMSRLDRFLGEKQKGTAKGKRILRAFRKSCCRKDCPKVRY